MLNVSMTTNIMAQFSSFVVVAVFTACLIQIFLRKVQWRMSASTSGQNTALTSRDRKLVKMIMFLSCVFIVCSTPGILGAIVCSTPGILGAIVMLVDRDYGVSGRLRNLFVATFSVFFALGSINSAVSFFIYLHVSSKFRRTLREMIGCSESTHRGVSAGRSTLQGKRLPP
ncbi:uncharacterized protein LOC131954046 [Physella acuta]|uniref:uncharacterized protein LOC131954046 n=1 Tax=Physella acuta TaxID=109671 RepID=UPI0027DDCFE1|nr:uncharacterized protein LOC131954046 [Physella acuta]